MTVDALQLEKLDAGEGDLFVITAPGSISFEEAERIGKQWEGSFPGTKCVIFGNGLKLERVRMMRGMVSGDLGL